jgi:hypothetical protein
MSHNPFFLHATQMLPKVIFPSKKERYEVAVSPFPGTGGDAEIAPPHKYR